MDQGNNHHLELPPPLAGEDELDLSLSLTTSERPRLNASPSPPTVSSPSSQPPKSPAPKPPARLRTRRRRSTIEVKPNTVKEPPFPWATTQPCTIHTLNHLISHNTTFISGDMECKFCKAVHSIVYDLQSKFSEISDIIKSSKHLLHNRAPKSWTKPGLPSCLCCNGSSCLVPVVAVDYMKINWLFLLLSQTLGCLTLRHLKHFCASTGFYLTGAKDRLVYCTYLTLCKQLDPSGPFDLD
ncbi:hypothetical protein J5N97_010173 [Dioscorea zingiberensis]|uniref:DUF7086 domain-containing protein n=1 Tax=Dioscorea zingiberensis TaxID=325984 RepID=A0A9D5HMG1_9LILI|nr:hypothetical protein J5N97_010173 [Dioscorea zingiberensis]